MKNNTVLLTLEITEELAEKIKNNKYNLPHLLEDYEDDVKDMFFQ